MLHQLIVECSKTHVLSAKVDVKETLKQLVSD